VLVCPSEKGRAYVATCAPGVPSEVVPNGIASGRFCAACADPTTRATGRRALGIEAGAGVVLYAGRLAPEKRVVELLQAVRPLLVADPSARLIFVGAGSQAALLAKLAGGLEVGGQVVLTGGVPWQDMPRVYALADVFATASLSEIHPMTLIEAVSSGLPVVARRDPGIDGLILDGWNGFLVDSDADITVRLAALLDDEPTRQRFSQHAAAVAAGLSIGAHVDCLEALYRRTIETYSRKAR
jgi:1,2-diacylglycerol 3-alpha-glucosyltransferase